jgi:hypothetical protein
MMKFLGMVANFAVVLVMAFLLAAACVEAIQLIAQTNSPDKRCEQGEIVSSVWGKGWVCIKGRVLSPSGSLPSGIDLIAFVETGAGDVVEDGHLLGASYIAGDGAPPFAGLYGDVGHERFQVLILRT